MGKWPFNSKLWLYHVGSPSKSRWCHAVAPRASSEILGINSGKSPLTTSWGSSSSTKTMAGRPGNSQLENWKIVPFHKGKSTIPMVIFHSKPLDDASLLESHNFLSSSKDVHGECMATFSTSCWPWWHLWIWLWWDSKEPTKVPDNRDDVQSTCITLFWYMEQQETLLLTMEIHGIYAVNMQDGKTQDNVQLRYKWCNRVLHWFMADTVDERNPAPAKWCLKLPHYVPINWRRILQPSYACG